MCDLEFDLVAKTVNFSFSNASIESEEVFAFLALCQQLNQQAKRQKFSSTKQRDVVNDKYAFRCFLLKLGFVGEEFKGARRILLDRLSGNASFRTVEVMQNEKRKVKVQL